MENYILISRWRNALILLATISLIVSCNSPKQQPQKAELYSPNGKIRLAFALVENGKPSYTVAYNGKPVVDTSTIGLDIKGMKALAEGMEITSITYDSSDTKWPLPWGERDIVRDHYRQMTLQLKETASPNRQFNLIFRTYDDGIAFRYAIPQQDSLQDFVILEENTEFNTLGDNLCWWIPGDWDSYEHLYNTTRISEINALSKAKHPNLICSYIPKNAVNTPFTMVNPDSVYISIHEAALINYPAMTLLVDRDKHYFKTALVAGADSTTKATLSAPFTSPWRMIQISPTPGGLLESNLLLNLNEPNKLGDVSWFKPMKYCGIWWEMHIDKSSWSLASGKHGATTANAKRYIDFAAANGLGGVLVEGWNTGWERWIGFPDREGVFDFVTPYPDYNLEEVVAYGKSKGVELIMHHETSAAPRTYEQQLDTAYRLMERLGIHAVKTGYVGAIIPEGEHAYGQWMVNHYQKTVEEAAKHKIAVNIHEPIKDTGLRRTWPNLISREGVRGQEFNAWASDGGNPPEHLTIVPFTRMLAGPIDYTPGIFHLSLKPYKPNNQVNTTLAAQLATYVVIYSPIQMAADLPEHYEGQPAFQFIRDVPVDWAETKVIDAKIGDYVVIARKPRGVDNWFLGAISDENARDLSIPLGFLTPDVRYKAVIYRDGPKAHYKDNPTDVVIEEKVVARGDRLTIHLAPGGGVAVSFFKVEK